MDQLKTIKALIVDDEKIVCDFLMNLLKLEGVISKFAENGFKALEIAKKEKFDIIFIDVRMPKMDGLELLKELKKIEAGKLYLMMTGYSVEELLREAEKEGAAGSLKKPFDIELIREYINKVKPVK